MNKSVPELFLFQDNEVRRFVEAAQHMLPASARTQSYSDRLISLLSCSHHQARLAAQNLFCRILQDSRNAAVAREKGLLAHVVGQLDATSIQAVANAVSTMASLTAVKENVAPLFTAGVVPRLVKLLKSDAPLIRHNTVRTLAHLAMNEDIRQELQDLELIPQFLKFLEETTGVQPNEEDVFLLRVCSLWALASICQHRADILLQYEVVPVLLELVGEVGNSQIQDTTLSLLLQLTVLAPGRAEIVSEGGISKLVTFLGQKTEELLFLKKILQVLGNLCVDEKLRKQVAENESLVQSVLVTIGDLPPDSLVVEQCVKLLVNMIQDQRDMEAIREYGGLEVLLSLLHRRVKMKCDVHFLTMLLSNLLSDYGCMETCMDESVVQIYTVLLNSDHLQTRCEAARGISNITIYFEHWRSAFFRCGVVVPLLALLKSEHVESKVQALRAATNLAFSYSNAAKLIEDDFLPGALSKLVAGSNPVLRLRALNLATNLSSNAKMRPVLIREVSLTIAIPLLATKDRELVLSAVKLVTNYAVQGQIRRWMDSPDQSSVRKILNDLAGGSDSEVAVAASSALMNLSFPYERSYGEDKKTAAPLLDTGWDLETVERTLLEKKQEEERQRKILSRARMEQAAMQRKLNKERRLAEQDESDSTAKLRRNQVEGNATATTQPYLESIKTSEESTLAAVGKDSEHRREVETEQQRVEAQRIQGVDVKSIPKANSSGPEEIGKRTAEQASSKEDVSAGRGIDEQGLGRVSEVGKEPHTDNAPDSEESKLRRDETSLPDGEKVSAENSRKQGELVEAVSVKDAIPKEEQEVEKIHDSRKENLAGSSGIEAKQPEPKPPTENETEQVINSKDEKIPKEWKVGKKHGPHQGLDSEKTDYRGSRGRVIVGHHWRRPELQRKQEKKRLRILRAEEERMTEQVVQAEKRVRAAKEERRAAETAAKRQREVVEPNKVPESGDHSQQHSRRTKIAQELLCTEKSYLEGLQFIINAYLKPLVASCSSGKAAFVNREQVRAIFSNIEVISNFSSVLEDNIESRLQNWDEDTKIGDIFLKMSAFLRCYVEYVNNYDSASVLFSELREENKRFDAFISTVEAQQLDKPLYSLLITPVQRVPRYIMLLQQLVKYTWEKHPDFECLGRALAELGRIGVYINEKKRESEELCKLRDLQCKLVGSRLGPKLPSIVSPARRLAYEGSLNWLTTGMAGLRSRSVLAFLFNDLLILTKPQGKGKFSFRGQMLLENAVFEVVDGEIKGNSNCFRIVGSAAANEAETQMTFSAFSPNQKSIWLEKLREQQVRTLQARERFLEQQHQHSIIL